MSTADLFLSVIPAMAASSAGGALVGSLLNSWWGRRSAKKVPKTEMRAEAYEDFVVYFVAAESDLELHKVKARLMLYGESAVVVAAADFLSSHGALGSNPANEAFLRVVREMRTSLLTGDGSRVMGSIEKMLARLPVRAHEP